MSTSELLPHDPFIIPDDPKSLPRTMRARVAFELRQAGASYELIAEKLGYASAETASKAVHNSLKKLYKPDDVQEVVTLELQRLDALQLIAWRRAKEGDLQAIDRILKIMERRAKYLGLDTTETQSTGNVHNTAIFIGGTEEEYVASLQQARERALEMITTGES